MRKASLIRIIDKKEDWFNFTDVEFEWQKENTIKIIKKDKTFLITIPEHQMVFIELNTKE